MELNGLTTESCKIHHLGVRQHSTVGSLSTSDSSHAVLKAMLLNTKGMYVNF